MVNSTDTMTPSQHGNKVTSGAGQEVVLFSEVMGVESTTCPLFRGCPLLRGNGEWSLQLVLCSGVVLFSEVMGSGVYNLSFVQGLSSSQR